MIHVRFRAGKRLLALLFSAATAFAAHADSIQIVAVKRVHTPVTIAVAGTVVARKAVTLTAQLPGRVQTITGQEGDRFKTGAVLVGLDDAALKAKLASARAAGASAAAQVRNAGTQLNRELANPQSNAAKSAPGGMGMPAMFDQMMFNPMQNVMGMRNNGIERRADVVQRQTRFTQAQSQRASSLSRIKEIEEKIRDSRSVAPFDGVIESVFVEVGDTVQPGQRLVAYSDTAGYQVKLDVPARLKKRLSKGKELSVRVDDAVAPVTATVSRIFPVADPRDHTVRVELDLPAGVDTTVGAYAEVAVEVPSKDSDGSLVVPAGSVVRKGGLPLVFVVDDEGVARLRVIRAGREQGAYVTVLSGLREGERVVLNPGPGFKGGVSVGDAGSTPARD